MADQAGARGQLMLQLAQMMRSTRVRVACGLIVFALCLLVGRIWFGAGDKPATVELELPAALKSLDGDAPALKSSAALNTDKLVPLDVAPSDNVTPDAQLLAVYRDMAANRLSDAQAKADRLVQNFPNFRLGHLIRGDLLMMHARPVGVMGAAPNGAPDKLKDLRDEALVRVNALRMRPDPALVPRALLQMRPEQKYALVVDARQSRLYVYENRGGKLLFLTDYYVTQGKLGVNKIKAGDQRTPLGVYYITSRIDRRRLPGFYGSGALPLNYPNEWDKVNSRSGSGIWLHGTPNTTYSRAPLASDGCVVLTNADLEKLTQSVEIGKTPVVISDKVDFISRAQAETERQAANRMQDGWRRDIEQMDAARILAHYSARFKSAQGQDAATWYAKNRIVGPAATGLQVKLSDLTFFRYPGRDDMIVSSFTQDNTAGKSKTTLHKRQYWVHEGSEWKIIHEALVNPQ